MRTSLFALPLCCLLACSASPATTLQCPAAPSPPSTTPPTPPSTTTSNAPPTVADAEAFVAKVDVELRAIRVQGMHAAWVNETYITDDTDKLLAHAQEAEMEYLTRVIAQAVKFLPLEKAGVLPKDVARKLHLLRIASTIPAPSDPKAREELASLAVSMTSMYGKGKYCPDRLKNKPKKCLTLDDLEASMAKSTTSYDELLDDWTGWHSIATPMRPMYARYVELANQGAKEIAFRDVGELWRSYYDLTPEQLMAETERLWQQVKPLYDKLHCYVRSKLRARYGKDKIGEKAKIPAHLLGNMWAQEWENVYSLVEPYKGEPSIDVTAKIKAKKLDEKAMVKIGETFFTSLGFDPLPKTFWDNSMFSRPVGREVVCHASAWDLTYAGDVRLKMCIQKDESDLLVIHHELGHVFYYESYKTLPITFEDAPNDGFHEAIGDAMALSVTPSYLKKIGLLDQLPKTEHGELNVMMKQALERVAFLPFGLLVDRWRWQVFSGETKKEDYVRAWWDLREKYQGIVAPVARSESDFDPGAKFHVASSTPYMRYFLASIFTFQFHRALCRLAGDKGPISKCSIYESKVAGEKLRAMLSMGASRPWSEALEALSGEKDADASALLEYYAPLSAFLDEQNKGEQCGW